MDADDSTTSSDPIVQSSSKNNSNSIGKTHPKKRMRESSLLPQLEMEVSSSALAVDNDKLARLRWNADMERVLTACVEPHIRVTPGKGLRQVDWNAVLDEMNLKYPLFGFTRKSLKNKYQRLGGLSLAGTVGLNDSLADTSAAEDDEEASSTVKVKVARLSGVTNDKKNGGINTGDKTGFTLSVDSILAADKEAFLISQAITEFNTDDRYQEIRNDPNKALIIIEHLMNYENAKKFFLVKPESLRVLFVQKWADKKHEMNHHSQDLNNNHNNPTSE